MPYGFFMVTFQLESFKDSREEFKEFFPSHWSEGGANNDTLDLDPHWDLYDELESVEGIVFATAREDKTPVGYFLGMIAPALHSKNCINCTLDLFFIREDKRGSGLADNLISFVEDCLAKIGVTRLFVGAKTGSRACAFFEKSGFVTSETYYSKMIGG